MERVNLSEYTDEELDDLRTSIIIEKMTREGMRRLTVGDLHRAKKALDGIPLIGDLCYDHVPKPMPMPIIELKELNRVEDIDPFDYEIYGKKTGFNPFPMHGVSPNDVFNKKRKRKR